MPYCCGVLFLVCSLGVLAASASEYPMQENARKPDQGGVEYFEKHIRPLLSQQCQSCHGPQKQKGGLRLDSVEAILKGGETGVIISKGDAARSLMFQVVSYEHETKMPPRGKLPVEQIEAIRKWIEMGAPMPASSNDSQASIQSTAFDLKQRAQYWSYQPLRSVDIPAVKDKDWPLTSIDPFILEKLSKGGLTPSPEADKLTWLRRVTFDLTGLPPSLDDIKSFEEAKTPDAYHELVDRLLASPQYGERWARHWLDLMRYADTLGHEFDFDLPNAWRYRNYVIRAINSDVPYNQFVLEHLAGDLLPDPRMDKKQQWNESIQGTGFLWLGEAKQAPVDVRQEQADRIDNQIDVIGKAFLGQTIACARCHDHKFDAIATRDYYALYGVLKSSRYQQAIIDDPGVTSALLESLKRTQRSLQAEVQKHMNEMQPKGKTAGDLSQWMQAAADLSPSEKIRILSLDKSMSQGPAWQRCQESCTALYVDPKTKQHFTRYVPANAWDSGLVSDKLEGALRTPTFDIQQRFLHLQASGQHARIRVVVDGFVVIRDPIYGGLRRIINEPRPRWYTFDLSMWKGRQAYVEFLDGGPADISTGDENAGKDAWLHVRHVFMSEMNRPPVNESEQAREEHLFHQPLPPQGAWSPVLEQKQKLEKQFPRPRYALATADGTGLDERVFVRGSHQKLGDSVPRGLSPIFCGEGVICNGSGSGRLDLAERLVDPHRNPFIVRVFVNRIWKHHFGQGLVHSVDDFGHMGDKPDHPELLEHLSNWFIQNGWSLKKLHRELVLSRTYRQSSAASVQSMKLDVRNELLSRMSVRRLEAEALRDTMLTVAGKLKPEMIESGVMPYLSGYMQGRGRPSVSGPLDGEGRRSIYLSVRRNFLSPLFTSFDFPTPFTAIGRRSVSNVPAQSLALMNDPLVNELTRSWAQAMIKRHPLIADRIRTMCLMAYGHQPSQQMSSDLLAFAEECSRNNGGDELRAWTEIAHALFCSKEFIFVP